MISNDGHPFAAGLTLAKLAAVTVDESGKETFVTGGALDRIQKVSLWIRFSFILTIMHVIVSWSL